jgi:hypothetical protein
MTTERKLGCKLTPEHRLRTVPFIHDHLKGGMIRPLIADELDFQQRMTKPWGMLKNNTIGCCFFSAYGHYAQCASANYSGIIRNVTDDMVVNWYKSTGYDPSQTDASGNNPTDQGTNPLDGLKYLMSIGEIIAFGQIDPKNDVHVATGIELFGGGLSGINLPVAWQDDTIPWDVSPDGIVTGDWAPGSWGGHATNPLGFNGQCDTPIVTWGMVKNYTAAARRVYEAERYAIITRDWIATNRRSLNNIDLQGLIDRLALVA